MQIVYGEPRTGSHFIARNFANQYNKIFLGEYFKSPIPNAQVNIFKKIDTLPKNSVIIVHPDLSYGQYPEEFYTWLFSNELIVTETNDRWRQVVSWGLAAKTTNYHSYNGSRYLKQNIAYKRNFFDMLKNSIKKYNETKHLIKYKDLINLSSIKKQQVFEGKYQLPHKTYRQKTDELCLMYSNLNEVKQWYNELL